MSEADLVRRVEILEEKMRAQELLRAAQDLDLAGLTERQRAHTRMLQAIIDTQGEQGRRLTKVESDVTELKTGQSTVLQGQETIIAMLSRLLENEA